MGESLPGASAGSVDVLYVDDEPGLLDLGSAMLEREAPALSVHTEASAQAGLDHLETAHVDCVVSDYNMPDMDGLEFLAAVRDAHPDLPFILFTGRGSEEIASDAISAGVTDYLQKGHGTDQYTVLANRVRNAVEQSRARVALQEREESLRRAQRVAALGNWDWDIEAGTLYWSDEIFRIFGVDPDTFDATYEAFLAFVHPDDRERVTAAVDAALAGDAPYDIQHRIQTDDGEERVVHERAEIHREDGDPVLMTGTVQDVTDRVATRRERDALRTAVDVASEVVFWADVDGTVCDVNPRFEALTGHERGDVVGQPPRWLWAETSAATGGEAWAEAAAGTPWTGRLALAGQTGPVAVDLTLTPVREDGVVEQVVAVGRPLPDD